MPPAVCGDGSSKARVGVQRSLLEVSAAIAVTLCATQKALSCSAGSGIKVLFRKAFTIGHASKSRGMTALAPPAMRKYVSVCASHCMLLPVTPKGSTSTVSPGVNHVRYMVEAKKGGVTAGAVKAP